MPPYEVTALLVGVVVSGCGFAVGRVRGNTPDPLQVGGLFISGAGLATPVMIVWTAFQSDIQTIDLTLGVRIALTFGGGSMFWYSGRGFVRLCREIVKGPEPRDLDGPK